MAATSRSSTTRGSRAAAELRAVRSRPGPQPASKDMIIPIGVARPCCAEVNDLDHSVISGVVTRTRWRHGEPSSWDIMAKFPHSAEPRNLCDRRSNVPRRGDASAAARRQSRSIEAWGIPELFMSIARLVAFTSLVAGTFAHAQDCAHQSAGGRQREQRGSMRLAAHHQLAPRPRAAGLPDLPRHHPQLRRRRATRRSRVAARSQDGSVPPLVPQYYWIRAFNDCGVSDPVGGVSSMRLATPAGGRPTSGPPTPARATPSPSHGTLRWVPRTYRVYRSTSASSSGASLVATVADPECCGIHPLPRASCLLLRRCG
jgi:hypothetical protein